MGDVGLKAMGEKGVLETAAGLPDLFCLCVDHADLRNVFHVDLHTLTGVSHLLIGLGDSPHNAH